MWLFRGQTFRLQCLGVRPFHHLCVVATTGPEEPSIERDARPGYGKNTKQVRSTALQKLCHDFASALIRRKQRQSRRANNTSNRLQKRCKDSLEGTNIETKHRMQLVHLRFQQEREHAPRVRGPMHECVSQSWDNLESATFWPHGNQTSTQQNQNGMSSHCIVLKLGH